MNSFPSIAIGLALLAGPVAAQTTLDQPDKARTHPLDAREPRQEVIEQTSPHKAASTERGTHSRPERPADATGERLDPTPLPDDALPDKKTAPGT